MLVAKKLGDLMIGAMKFTQNDHAIDLPGGWGDVTGSRSPLVWGYAHP